MLGRPTTPSLPAFPRVVSSWIERRKVQSEKANLMILFDKYLPTCLDKLRFGFKKITPIPEITITQMILYLLECLLTERNAPPDSPKELYELYFVFACFWAFGGALFQDQVRGRPPGSPLPREGSGVPRRDLATTFVFSQQLVDYRVEFSKWWINEFKTIKFPSQGTIFDYYIDPDTKKFLPWTEKVPAFALDPDIPLQVPARGRRFMDKSGAGLSIPARASRRTARGPQLPTVGQGTRLPRRARRREAGMRGSSFASRPRWCTRQRPSESATSWTCSWRSRGR